ncbi:hypothetical protein CPB97_004296 [Podila verticillata]|nr:hypothetical protein CPB97_004296 [Podila verticillata]
MTNNRMSLFCLVDGEAMSNAFPVKISSDDTVADLKNLIRTALVPQFDDIAAKDLILWCVSIPNDNLGSSVAIDALDNKALLNTPRTRLFILFPKSPDDNTYIVIRRPPPAVSSIKRKWLSAEADRRIVRPKIPVEPYDGREASLVFRKERFRGFPLNDKRDFETIRAHSELAYFDRTRYISELGSFKEDVLVFLRPRRFGKSLFLSTLAHFHGVEYKQNYKALFQCLDVDRDVEIGKVSPGQYLILAFDFSKVNRSPNLETAEECLGGMINNAVEAFYQTYAPFLGHKASEELINEKISSSDPVKSLGRLVNLVREALNAVTERDDPLDGVKADEYDAFSNEFLDPNDHRPWEQLRTGPSSLLKGFWATVKGNLGSRSIVKCFITGVSPLSMADHTSGFNIATYVTWHEEMSGLCGLTTEDVLSALRLPNVCRSEDEVQNHFGIMKNNYDGYCFVEMGEAQHVLNTNTCLEYLEGLIRGKPIDPMAVKNSEVSEPALQILAASPVATSIISDSLRNPILPSGNYPITYERLEESFRLTHLVSDIETSKPAWLSYMLHIGGLTFCPGAKQLQIPNLVAAERFSKAVLDRYGLRLEDVSLAFKNIVSTGDIGQAFTLYRQTMSARDVGYRDFEKKEEHHRDSFHYALLGNSHPSLRTVELEVKINKPLQGGPGRIDMRILIPSKKRILVLEWKVIQIDYLDLGIVASREKKAERLDGTFEASAILGLKFGRNDRWRQGQTIKEWILQGPRDGQLKISPREQLATYLASEEIAHLKEEHKVTGYLVVVVGCRQILLWEMNDDGTLHSAPLAA